MKTSEFVKRIKSLGFLAETQISVPGYGYNLVVYNSDKQMIGSIDMKKRFTMETYGGVEGASEVFDLLALYARTPLVEREEEKRYIVPLPDLTTTDGEQQYLTKKGGYFFASRRNKDLRQTWKEEDLCFVPDQYREYAVEVEE